MKKRIILSCHCILNKYSKLEGVSPKNPDIVKLLKFLLENNIGIIQLPCAEMHVYGTKRWGHVKEQFDTSNYRETSQKLLKPIIGQIKDYINHDYELVGTISIEGSPSCGAFNTCKSKEWSGEFKDMRKVAEKVSSIKYTRDRGVFLEELDKMLDSIGVKSKYFGLYGQEIDRLISDINKCIRNIKI